MKNYRYPKYFISDENYKGRRNLRKIDKKGDIAYYYSFSDQKWIKMLAVDEDYLRKILYFDNKTEKYKSKYYKISKEELALIL